MIAAPDEPTNNPTPIRQQPESTEAQPQKTDSSTATEHDNDVASNRASENEPLLSDDPSSVLESTDDINKRKVLISETDIIDSEQDEGTDTEEDAEANPEEVTETEQAVEGEVEPQIAEAIPETGDGPMFAVDANGELIEVPLENQLPNGEQNMVQKVKGKSNESLSPVEHELMVNELMDVFKSIKGCN